MYFTPRLAKSGERRVAEEDTLDFITPVTVIFIYFRFTLTHPGYNKLKNRY